MGWQQPYAVPGNVTAAVSNGCLEVVEVGLLEARSDSPRLVKSSLYWN